MKSVARSLLSAFCLGMLAIQAGIDRVFGRSLVLGMGVDAPVTSSAAATTAAPAVASTAAPAAPAAVPATSEAPAAPAAAAPAAPAAAAPAVAPASTAPTLRGLIQSIRTGAQTGAELVAARQSITTLTAERDQARTQLAAVTAQRDAFAAFLGITAAELAGKPAAEVTKLIQQKVSDQAAEQVAGMGLPASQLPPQGKGEGAAGDTIEEIQAQLAAEKDPLKRGQLAAKANKLRDAQWAKN